MTSRLFALLLLLAGGVAAQNPPPPKPANPPPAPKTAAEEIEAVLSSRKVTLNFPQTPLSEVVAFLQDITGLNIAVDPALDLEGTTITLQVQNIVLRNALDLIANNGDFQTRVWADVLWLGPPGKDPGTPPTPGPDKLGTKLSSQQLTVNFDQTPFEEVLNFLHDITSLTYELTPAAQKVVEDRTVSLRLKNISLASVVTISTLPLGLVWRQKEDGSGLVIDVQPKR